MKKMTRHGGLRRKGWTAIPATIAALVLFASPAFAHFCSNVQRSETANAAVNKNSNGWFTMAEAIPEFLPDLCVEGVNALVGLFEKAGVDTDRPILAHAVLGGGALHHGKQPKPFGYLPDIDFDALIPQAYEVCEP